VRLALRALLVAAVALVATQSGAAARSSTVPESIVFWNTHLGLLAAEQGKRGVVELTSDGGHSYQVVLHTRRPVYLQTFGHGGAIASTPSGRSWQTLDAGRTWRRISSQPAADWLSPRLGVRFHSYVTHGHAALAMLVTHDDGHTWQRRKGPCRKPGIAFGAFADLVTAKSWWVACVGEGGAGNENKAIYRTRDGGRTWEAGAASIVLATRPHAHGGVSTYGYPSGLAFVSSGWGLLTESRGTLYVSRDGGMHFRAEPHVAVPETDFAGGAAAFPGGTGYVILTSFRGARLIETHDFGRTWRVVRRWRR
jgi:photosystem II stability/assembly factor-like uncharacterized protein